MLYTNVQAAAKLLSCSKYKNQAFPCDGSDEDPKTQ